MAHTPRSPTCLHRPGRVMPGSEGRWIFKVTGWMILSVWLLVCSAAAYYYSRDRDVANSSILSASRSPIANEVEVSTGKDVDTLKDGKSNQ